MAATKPWHYLQNSILVATRQSYRAMKKIGSYSVLALLGSTDIAIVALGSALETYYDDFLEKYNAWISNLGTQGGDTNDLYVELELIRSTKARYWDIRIQAVWEVTSSQYKAALPKRRKGLQGGSQDDIIAYLTNLNTKLTGVIPLSAVKTDVAAHLLTLQTAYDVQKATIAGSGTTSNDVETARVTLAQQMYKVLGSLMAIFFVNPLLIIPFFNIPAIRNIEQTLWRRFAKANTTAYVFTRTLLVTDDLRLVNMGLEPLMFGFLANKSDMLTPAGSVTINPLDGQTVSRADLGPIAYKFMMVQNASGTKVKYMIVII